MRRSIKIVLVLALVSGACSEPNAEGPANTIATTTSSTKAPTTTIDPRYWCPGLGYCDFPEPSRDPLWPRTYTGSVVSHAPYESKLWPLTLDIKVVDTAHGLVVETSDGGPRSTVDQDEAPEWYFDEVGNPIGFPAEYPDPDRHGFLQCLPVFSPFLVSGLYEQIGVDCDLYLPYVYGRREVPSLDGYGNRPGPTPLLVLEDTIDYNDAARDLPGAEFHIERVGWSGDTKGTVIKGSWCETSDCAIVHVFQAVALPGLETRPSGVTEETLYAANRVAMAVQNGEMTKAEAERSLLDVVVGLRRDAVTWIVRNMPVYDQTDGTWSSFETYAIELADDSGIPPNSRLATDPVGTAVDLAFGDATADDMINWMGLSSP